jgi:hypothetical protein
MMGFLPRSSVSLTKKGNLERKTVSKAIRDVGPVYQVMASRLLGLSKPQLLQLAQKHIERTGVPKLGRIEKRQRRSLICWFCRFAPEFPEGVSVPEQRDRQENDETTNEEFPWNFEWVEDNDDEWVEFLP